MLCGQFAVLHISRRAGISGHRLTSKVLKFVSIVLSICRFLYNVYGVLEMFLGLSALILSTSYHQRSRKKMIFLLTCEMLTELEIDWCDSL